MKRKSYIITRKKMDNHGFGCFDAIALKQIIIYFTLPGIISLIILLIIIFLRKKIIKKYYFSIYVVTLFLSLNVLVIKSEYNGCGGYEGIAFKGIESSPEIFISAIVPTLVFTIFVFTYTKAQSINKLKWVRYLSGFIIFSSLTLGFLGLITNLYHAYNSGLDEIIKDKIINWFI